MHAMIQLDLISFFFLKNLRLQNKVKLGLPTLKVSFFLNVGKKRKKNPPRESFPNTNMRLSSWEDGKEGDRSKRALPGHL